MTVHPKNIRFRLIAWYIFSLGIVHLIVATGLYKMVSVKLHHEFDQRLETYSTCLVNLLPQHRHLELASVIDEMAELSALGPERYLRVVDGQGRVVYESTSLPPAAAARLREAMGTAQERPMTIRLPDFGSWRLVIRSVGEGEQGGPAYVGRVAIPLRMVEKALAQLGLILVVVVPCFMILASFGAWRLLGRALLPLHEVIRTARAIQAKDFSQRLRVPNTGDEVQALAETFNEMIDRLHYAFDQMRRFVADASHELRTPLAVLKGEVELGLKANHSSSCPACAAGATGRQEILEACSGEIGRMARLVETLLFLSNADAEKVALECKPTPLGRVIDEMAEEARILAETKRLRVEVRNGSDAVVQADEMRLKQLLLNLIDNAVKYTPAGGTISLGCHARDGRVELTVADTGVGIEARDCDRIFHRFYRVDSARSYQDGGYGLGLSICKWIAEAHNGTIRVESSPGKGSAFYVSLPLA